MTGPRGSKVCLLKKLFGQPADGVPGLAGPLRPAGDVGHGVFLGVAPADRDPVDFNPVDVLGLGKAGHEDDLYFA